MDRFLSFSKYGHRKIPRPWRALQGWRKLCPARSRLAYPLQVWWDFVEDGGSWSCEQSCLQPVASYHRPNTLLNLRKMGLVRPTSGVTTHSSMITNITETTDVSRIGAKDESILLDSPWLIFLDPVLEVLSKGPKLQKVWDFNCSEHLSVFKDCCRDLKVELVPYQARHSGPSIDRSKKLRDQEEVRRRGQWLARQSVMRYEKAGRLAATWHRLSPETQMACQSAERYIEEIILGQRFPHIGLPR